MIWSIPPVPRWNLRRVRGIPSPAYGLNSDDLITRQGAVLSPSALTNGSAGGRYADRFSTIVPPTNASVFWQSENALCVLDVGANADIFQNDDSSSYNGFLDGPKTGSAGSPDYVLNDAPCTVAFLMWHSTVVGGTGYAAFCSIIEPTSGWGRDFSFSTTNVTTTGETYVTFKPDVTTILYGTAASPNANFRDVPAIFVVRQDAENISFSVVNYTTGVAYAGGYTESRVPTGNKLRLRIGVNSSDATCLWRSTGVLAWQTGRHLSDASIHSVVRQYLIS